MSSKCSNDDMHMSQYSKNKGRYCHNKSEKEYNEGTHINDVKKGLTKNTVMLTGEKRLSSKSTQEAGNAGITIKLNPSKKSKPESDSPNQKKAKVVAAVFNQDSDPEEEEMPLECRMKMRNLGRNTITSSGPNSFNKGKQGFSANRYKP